MFNQLVETILNYEFKEHYQVTWTKLGSLTVRTLDLTIGRSFVRLPVVSFWVHDCL